MKHFMPLSTSIVILSVLTGVVVGIQSLEKRLCSSGVQMKECRRAPVHHRNHKECEMDSRNCC